jgi:hypothetical protein
LLICLAVAPARAWEGYDFENRDRIDIGPGNLVREGLTIQFYDIKADDYHTAKEVDIPKGFIVSGDILNKEGVIDILEAIKNLISCYPNTIANLCFTSKRAAP